MKNLRNILNAHSVPPPKKKTHKVPWFPEFTKLTELSQKSYFATSKIVRSLTRKQILTFYRG
jgi:hypothetical protein